MGEVSVRADDDTGRALGAGLEGQFLLAFRYAQDLFAQFLYDN